MYRELFGLKELPFRLSPDPDFLFLSAHHARAKAYMESTIWLTDGFVAITGEIGSGKTTLIETFLRSLDKDVLVAQINQTSLTPLGFLQTVLAQFGFSPFKMGKAELIHTLNTFLIEQYAANRKVLLIIDEAQNLPNAVLEEVRMLSGVETTKDKILRIILAGQPELSAKLNAPDLVQLSQRIRLKFHLTPLSDTDTSAYVRHRLKIAGANDDSIFTDEALKKIFRYSGGVPRLINTLCDTAMMAAFATDKTLVDTAEVQAAIDELGWTEYASNTSNYARINLDMSQTSVVGRITLSYDGNIISSHDLSPGRLLIGRTAQNDLRLDSTYISRHHCQINVTPGSVLIEDLNSTNGLYYKGRKVRRQVLSHNTAINIGRYTLTYLEDTDHTSTHTLSADAQQTISADSTAATETEDPNQAEV